MFNPFLVLFVFSELSFYLLIAQTGVVEIFHSDLSLIFYLPLGGVLGTFIISHLNFSKKLLSYFLLSLQLLAAFFYPNFSPLLLLLLGFSVGGLSPIIIDTLKKASRIDLLLTLALSYTLGTLLFSSDPLGRGYLAILLSLGALFGYFLFKLNLFKPKTIPLKHYSYPLLLMVVWVLLDSSLFETLSRNSSISIWRDGFSTEIVIFHILGVVAALFIKLDSSKRSLLITLLFSFSYLFYFIESPLALSIVYPFVISYYNVVILQTLVGYKSFKSIGISMIFIGWLASGGGLMVAIGEIISFIPLLLVILFVYNLTKEFYFIQGVLSCQKD